MPIDGKKYQTVLIKKEQAERLKKLSRDSRYPMTKLVGYAIDILLEEDPGGWANSNTVNLIDGKVKL